MSCYTQDTLKREKLLLSKIDVEDDLEGSLQFVLEEKNLWWVKEVRRTLSTGNTDEVDSW